MLGLMGRMWGSTMANAEDPCDTVERIEMLTTLPGAGELRYVLTQLGEKMSDEEVDELLKGVQVGA